MKKSAIALMLTAAVVSSVPAQAAGKLSVTQENFHVIDNYGLTGYAYAKVENIGDKPITVNAGLLEILDKEGDAITSVDYMNPLPSVLQPGEYGYAYFRTDISGVESADDVDDYILTISGKSEIEKEVNRLPAEGSFALDVSEGYWTSDFMYATVTNNTDEILYNVQVVLSLLDAEGNILLVEDSSLYNTGIAPGSTVVVREEIYSSTMDYFDANGLTPAQVDVIAYTENYLD